MITIQEHTYSCQYGTLIGNCDKQRKELNLRERTHSLWGYLVTHNDEFVNPLYDRNSQSQIIRPNLSPQNIKFWRGLYCRFETGAHPREPVIDLLTITQVGQKYKVQRKVTGMYLRGNFWCYLCDCGQICPPGWNRVKVSENLQLHPWLHTFLKKHDIYLNIFIYLNPDSEQFASRLCVDR